MRARTRATKRARRGAAAVSRGRVAVDLTPAQPEGWRDGVAALWAIVKYRWVD